MTWKDFSSEMLTCHLLEAGDIILAVRYSCADAQGYQLKVKYYPALIARKFPERLPPRGVSLTWRAFQEIVEARGVQDTDTIVGIDIGDEDFAVDRKRRPPRVEVRITSSSPAS